MYETDEELAEVQSATIKTIESNRCCLKLFVVKSSEYSCKDGDNYWIWSPRGGRRGCLQNICNVFEDNCVYMWDSYLVNIVVKCSYCSSVSN